MCTCSMFVCRHKNNDMSTLLGHAHTYIPTDRQTDTQAYIHKSIQTYSYTYTWLHMCDVSPLWGGGWGGTRGGWIIYMFLSCELFASNASLNFARSCLKNIKTHEILRFSQSRGSFPFEFPLRSWSHEMARKKGRGFQRQTQQKAFDFATSTIFHQKVGTT